MSPNIKTKRVCDILPAVRALTVNLLSAFCRPFHCWQRCHGDENCLQLFVIILRDQVFSRRAQFFIMIVDVGKRLLQLKSMYCNSFHGIYLRKNHSDIPAHAGPPPTHSSSNRGNRDVYTYIVLFSLVYRLLVAVAAGHAKHPREAAALRWAQASLEHTGRAINNTPLSYDHSTTSS